jgi:hypothetical protein
MGLDMYLEKKTYVKNWDHMGESERWKIDVSHPRHQIDASKVKYLVEEAAYWRKANAIHKWFVDNIQDGRDECQQSYVSAEGLSELVNLCQRVLDDHSLAHELLPACSGFFFGSTDYDEWYFKDLQYTVDTLVPLIQKENEVPLSDFYYHASW